MVTVPTCCPLTRSSWAEGWSWRCSKCAGAWCWLVAIQLAANASGGGGESELLSKGDWWEKQQGRVRYMNNEVLQCRPSRTRLRLLLRYSLVLAIVSVPVEAVAVPPTGLAAPNVGSGAGIISTIAGGGVGDGSPAAAAWLVSPQGMALDGSGNLYVADRGNHRVRRIDAASGVMTTVAGTGDFGFAGDGGPASNSSVWPSGVAVDSAGNLFIADNFNNRIRRVDAVSGVISTVAGNGVSGFSGDGGPAVAASLYLPSAVAVDTAGNLFIADVGNERVRRVDAVSGVITTVAGNGGHGWSGDSAPAVAAELCQPNGVAVGAAGNLYIADWCDNRIRRVDAISHIVTTVAGDGTASWKGDGGLAVDAGLSPSSVFVDSFGNLFLADVGSNRIRRVDAVSHIITTVAGGGNPRIIGDGGPATNASLFTPTSVVVSPSGNIYVSEWGFVDYDLLGPFRSDGRIRRVDANSGVIATVAGGVGVGDGRQATSARVVEPAGITTDAFGNLYIADFADSRVRRVDAGSGAMTTIAGIGTAQFERWGDGGPARDAQLRTPADVAIDGDGNLYIADPLANAVRRVEADTGLISTVAGTGQAGFSGDGGPANNAQLAHPWAVAVDAAKNVYIADNGNQRVRKISTSGIISTVAGNGNTGFQGDGGLAINASLNFFDQTPGRPGGLDVDPFGNLFIADRLNQRIRRVDSATGVITTVAGTGVDGTGGDGGRATDANLSLPANVAVDTVGNLFISDRGGSLVRKVDAVSGVISAVAGSGVAGMAGDGGPSTSALISGAQGIAVDAAGNLYLTENYLGNSRVRLVTAGSPAACAEMDPVVPGVSPLAPSAGRAQAGGSAIASVVPQATAMAPAPRFVGGISTKAVFGSDRYGSFNRDVNASIQSLVLTSRDVSVAGIGPSLELVRTYNSADIRPGLFGRGWTSTFEARVSPNVLTGCSTVALGDGRRGFYLANVAAPGTYLTPRGYSSLLTGNAAAGWSLTDADGTKRVFRGTDGRLISVTDTRGHALLLTWDASSQLSTVRDAVSGRQLAFTYSNGRVTSISTSSVSAGGSPPAQLIWRYGYSGQDLVAVCDPRNNDLVSGFCTRYTVSVTLGLITQVKDPRNQVVKRIGYRDGKVEWEEDGSGNRTTFSSKLMLAGPVAQQASCEQSAGEAVETKTTDPRGHVTTSVFDSCFRLVRKVDAIGGETRYEYDARGFNSKVTYANGTATARSYDERGNVLAETNGAGESTWFTYDSFNNMLSVRDGRSATSSDNTYAVTFSWDGARRTPLSRSTPATPQQPSGTTQRWTYTAGSEAAVGGGVMPAGLLRTEVDARGRTLTYGYDRLGNLRQVTDRVGLVTAYAYDELGRRVSQTVYATGFTAGVTTSYAYDALGNLVQQDDPPVTDVVSGLTRRKRMVATIDAAGNTAQVLESDIGGSATPDAPRTTRYAYDAADRPIRVTDPEGGVTSNVYDSAGNLVQVTDPRGVVRVTDYDARNLPVKVTAKGVAYAEGVVAPHDVVESQTTYDAGGRVATRTDAAGRTTRFGYDGADRVTSKTLVGYLDGAGVTRDLAIEVTSYDKAGNPVAVTTGGGLLTETRVFDQAGRLVTRTVDPAGANRVTGYTYDANGNVVRQVTSRGGRNEEVRFAFDAADRLTSKTVENGAVDLVTSYQYDNRGVKVSQADPRGNVAGAVASNFTASFTPDALGRVVRVQSPPVSRSEMGVDTAGVRPERVYGFDTFGQQVEVRDERGFITRQVRDGLGRVTRTTYPSYTPPGGVAIVPVELFGYDANGNLVSKTDRRGQTTTYLFDGLNRVVRQTDPKVGAAAAGVVSIGYDDVGNTVWRVDQRGARTRWTYDALNHPLTETREVRQPSLQSFTTRFGYDDLGNRVSITDPAGNVTRFEYSRLNEQTAVVDPAGGRTASVFDVAGRVTSVTDPLGRRLETVFDLAGRATTVRRVASNGTPVWSVTQGWDPAGNRTSVTSPRGNLPTAVASQFSTTYGFDAVNRLVSVTEPVSATTTRSTGYGYDLAGNVSQVTDGRGNVTWYGYNEWGVQTVATEPTTTAHPNLTDRQWVTSLDAGGLPTRTVEPGGLTVTRTFDELGRPVAETGSGTGVVSATRTFGWDAGGLRVSAGTAGGNISFGYDDRGLLVSVSGPAGFAASSFQYDADGRMVSRTDAAGTTQVTWNTRSLPATVRDGLTGQTATYGWDAAKQLVGVDYSGGGRRQLVYDQAGRVTSDQLSTATGTVTAGYAYEWDADSNLATRTVTLPGNSGAGVNRYGYDNSGRLTSWTRPNNSTLAYAWDASGNLTTNAGVTQTFDQRNRMLTTGTTNYTWSARGTLMSQQTGGAAAVSFVFDGLDRQTGVGAQQTVYDSLNRVVSLGGTAFSYAGTESDPAKIGSILLAHGPTGQLLAAKPGTGTAVLADLDQHGDVGFWSSGTGAVSATRTYTPFGTPVASTGAWPAPVGFQGDYTDPSTNDVWMGARWYRPGTATFTSRDTVFGKLGTPVSLNRYTYAWADPLGMFDPDGHDPGCGVRYKHGDCWTSMFQKRVSSAAQGVSSSSAPPSSLDALSTRETVDWVYSGRRYPSAQDAARSRLNGPQPPTLFDGMAAYPCGGPKPCAHDGIGAWVTAAAKPSASFVVGAYDGVAGMARGAANMVRHPIDTAQSVWAAESACNFNPDCVSNRMVVQPFATEIKNNGLAHALGTLVPQVALAVATGGTAEAEQAAGFGLEEAATNTAPFGELANPATVNNASSPIRSFVTEADTTYLRVYSGDKTAGGFLMGSAPSSADSAVSGLALPPGNNADFIQEVLVPSGTRLQSSIAAPAFGQPGGLLQFELLDQIPVKNFGPGLPFR